MIIILDIFSAKTCLSAFPM